MMEENFKLQTPNSRETSKLKLQSLLMGWLAAAVGYLLAGCATPKFGGIDEYKQLTTQGDTVLRASLRSLELVSANLGHCTPKTMSDFQHAVQRLQVDSIRIRARARAIQARGDEYFGSWEQSMAGIKDPRMRDAANRSHAELQDSFAKIKVASQKAGAAFDPYLAGLLKLRVELENRSGNVDNEADRELIRNASAKGQEALREIGVIDSELVSMKKMLKSRYREAH